LRRPRGFQPADFCRSVILVNVFPATTEKDRQLAKPNYAFAKRQRDLAKKQKQEEKRKRKEELRTPPAGETVTPAPDTDKAAL
jgi:hypothetical protein